jgi:spore maturation protein CgeB
MDGHISERRKEGASITRLNDRVKDDADIAELWESVSNHPNYRGYLDTQELNGVLAQYEYALIAKNIARYDSINFRPALYLALGVFPLLDYRYDPDCKGIPAEIQEKIVVRSHEEIQERIAYYDAHPEEKEQVMHELKTHFNYYNFIQEWKKIIEKQMGISVGVALSH